MQFLSIKSVFFSFTGSGCGGELYNYGGQLSSPGYPNTDRNNSDCYWTINVPINLVVALKFQGKTSEICSKFSFIMKYILHL